MLNVKLLKAFEDNYFFVLTCLITNEVAVVDPGDSNVVIKGLNGNMLTKVLLTHHHHDHVGGVKKLCEIYNSGIVGFEKDAHRLPNVNTFVKEGEKIKVGESIAEIFYVPGHTMGHIAYYFEKDKKLFCGDTLFAGGCGRLFEGSAENMFNSLVKFKNLPDDVEVFCAHEYTVSNYEFAKHTMPNDEYVEQALIKAKKQRSAGIPTIPTTIGYEKIHNVFLRARTVEEFAKLRTAKDVF